MFFDRPDSGELAVLVHLQLSSERSANDPREFEELVLSAGGDPVEFLTGKRDTPHAKYFVGTGKLEELRQTVLENEAQIVIFNHELSPSQERNLEQVLQCRVLDRTGLILDIFAQRARTHEGKLQVELAQLHHMSTRLIRGWTHLERQKGGIGMRGPGETQLETDRRLLRARLKTLESRLQKVRKQREQSRRARTRASIPTVSLVGYTNAGKSTLFNTITEADVYAENKLFATLDPTMRRVELDDAGAIVLADTVGFVSNLPHRLVDAFRATLEEAANADLLLHVIDCADDLRDENIASVDTVLEEIGASDLPQLLIYNKIDLLEDRDARIDRKEDGTPYAVWLSASENKGVDLLIEAITELAGEDLFENTIEISPKLGAVRAKLYKRNAVVEEGYTETGGFRLHIRLPEIDLKKLLAEEHLAAKDLGLTEIDNRLCK